MKIVAISGWKRSGKDTAAEILISEGYKRVAFADVLKDMVAKEYDIPRAHCDDPAFKEAPILHLPVDPKDAFTKTIAELMFGEFRTAGGVTAIGFSYDESGKFVGVLGRSAETLYWTPRALCIFKGSGNRAVRSDFWVAKTIEDVHNISLENDTRHISKNLFVISDLRFKSEVSQLREAFGDQLVTVRVNRFDTCQSTDASERDLDNTSFDVLINNKGTLEEFNSYVKSVLTHIGD